MLYLSTNFETRYLLTSCSNRSIYKIFIFSPQYMLKVASSKSMTHHFEFLFSAIPRIQSTILDWRLWLWFRKRKQKSTKNTNKKKVHKFEKKTSFQAELPHPIYACVFLIVVHFWRAYIGWPNQDKLFENALQCGKRALTY